MGLHCVLTVIVLKLICAEISLIVSSGELSKEVVSCFDLWTSVTTHQTAHVGLEKIDSATVSALMSRIEALESCNPEAPVARSKLRSLKYLAYKY